MGKINVMSSKNYFLNKIAMYLVNESQPKATKTLVRLSVVSSKYHKHSNIVIVEESKTILLP